MAETETQLPAPVIITVGRMSKAEVNRSTPAAVIKRQREDLLAAFFLSGVFKCPFLGKYSPQKKLRNSANIMPYVVCG